MPLEFRPKIDKIVELLLYLAKTRPGSDKYQAVKFLYLADRAHLNKYGRPITHEVYFALPYGPVASKAMDLLNGDKWVMKEAGIDSLPFDLVKVTRGGKETVALCDPSRDVDFDLFSKSDIRIFDEVLSEYGDKDFDELFELTHGHYAYKKAWRGRAAGSKRALMSYEDMIEADDKRIDILRDIGPVSANM